MRFLRLSLAGIIVAGSILPAVATAQLAFTKGTIVVEQESTSEALGTWTLIKPGDTQVPGEGAATTIEDSPTGNYTLIARVPKGYVAHVAVYSGATLLQRVDYAQVTFTLSEASTVRIVVSYLLDRVGEVSVASDPVGLSFTLTGPNGLTRTGVTPQAFFDVPEGQYSVVYDVPEGCPKPPLQGHLLKKDSSTSFTVEISCDAADRMRQEQKDRASSDVNIVVTIDNQPVELFDVPKTAWFAPYVESAAEQGILTGYRDQSGNPTGMFGPENSVSMGELATIAHRLAGVNPDEVHDMPINLGARGQWFERFVASAEQRGWAAFMDSRDSLTRPATRAEVVVTLLQALDIPLHWQTGTVFHDVSARTEYAAAIETAYGEGLVSGRTDANGEATGMFSPDDPVNRAEMSKLIQLAVQNYRSE